MAQSRTSETEIEQLAYFYRLFRPNELAFVLELRKSWSPYDRNRCDTIAHLVRQTFNSHHTAHDVRAVIDFFNIKQSLELTHNQPLNIILSEQNATIHMNPCISICPLCQHQLNSNNAKSKCISIHCLTGEIQKGIVSRNCIVIVSILECYVYRNRIFIDL